MGTAAQPAAWSRQSAAATAARRRCRTWPTASRALRSTRPGPRTGLPPNRYRVQLAAWPGRPVPEDDCQRGPGQRGQYAPGQRPAGTDSHPELRRQVQHGAWAAAQSVHRDAVDHPSGPLMPDPLWDVPSGLDPGQAGGQVAARPRREPGLVPAKIIPGTGDSQKYSAGLSTSHNRGTDSCAL